MPNVKHRWLLLVLLGTLSAFGPLSMDLYLPGLPELQQQLHTTPALAQLTITASLIGLAVGQLLMGPLSDYLGRKKPLYAGLVIFMVTSFLAAITDNIWWLIILRVLQGVGGSAGQVLSRSIARDLFNGHQLTRFLAILMAINGIFPIISPVIGSGILVFTSWRGIFILLAVIGLILIGLTMTTLPETLPVDRRTNHISRAFIEMGQLVGNRAFMTYVLAQGFVYGALFSYISGSTFVYQDYYGLSAGVFSLFYAFNGLGIVTVTKLTGNLTGRFSEQKLLKISVLLGTVAAIVLLINAMTINAFAIMVAGLLVVVSLVGMVNTTATSLGMQLSGEHAGGASALLGLGMNAIGGLMSPLVGAFGTNSVTPMASLILASEVLAVIVLFTFKGEQS
ncbi:multidrug effflux MFS transporter [Lacticaseibacillus brantae]|nr:multidrug effflux MFS transporter [Lacticaseibacillus brantae]